MYVVKLFTTRRNRPLIVPIVRKLNGYGAIRVVTGTLTSHDNNIPKLKGQSILTTNCAMATVVEERRASIGVQSCRSKTPKKRFDTHHGTDANGRFGMIENGDKRTNSNLVIIV